MGLLLTFVSTQSLGGQENDVPATPIIRYVGSSTIAWFIRDAEASYGKARFVVDSQLESVSGAVAIHEHWADLAGVAGYPVPWDLKEGLEVSLLGRDAIAVIVNNTNPIRGLYRSQLRGVFSGRVTNWKELGGEDLPIHPFIVGPESATREVFRAAILGEEPYSGYELVRPDAKVIERVGKAKGGIGHISFSFLKDSSQVKSIRVDGEAALPTNPAYPVSRPLHLVWWPENTQVLDFISWIGTPAGRSVLLRYFAPLPEGEGRGGSLPGR